MPGAHSVPKLLIILAQTQLKMTQQAFADMLGVSRRTVIRWQDRDSVVDTERLLKLASALDATLPELAAQCRQIASRDDTVPASEEIVGEILQAAATAIGTSPEAVRPAVDAAFRAARARGVSPHGVVLGLTPGVVPPTQQA
jgi:transcriptional regulator with XRE-family HTH domain